MKLVYSIFCINYDLLGTNIEIEDLLLNIDKSTTEYDLLFTAAKYWTENMVDTSLEILSESESIIDKAKNINSKLVHEFIGILVLDSIAQKKMSNKLILDTIEKLIEFCSKYALVDDFVVIEYTIIASDRLSFLGKHVRAIELMKKIEIVKLNILKNNSTKSIEFYNKLGLYHLLISKENEAFRYFTMIHKIDHNEWYSLIHLGYLYMRMNNFEMASEYLEKGLKFCPKPEAKFYSFLSTVLIKLNQMDKAQIYHEQAANKGLFLSSLQRSTYNSVVKLRSIPWWKASDTDFSDDILYLEESFNIIKEEIAVYLNTTYYENSNNQKDFLFKLETEGLSQFGDWKQLDLFVSGQKRSACDRFFKTCKIIERTQSVKCRRGQVKFSLMKPKTRVYPHTGPTNCRIRAHLGIVIPIGAFIRVANEIRRWEEGKILLFDDSFEHDVWNDGPSDRLILILDFWHPDVPEWERKSLSPM